MVKNRKLRVGICTGGGDCPGLNAVIRSVVRYGLSTYGMEVYGIHDSFDGLLSEPMRFTKLDFADVEEIWSRGGTMLGTCNRGKTFEGPEGQKKRAQVVQGFKQLGLDAFIVVGGEGTQTMTKVLSSEIPVIGIPKTIDNDLSGTDQTIGFSTCVDLVSESTMRLRSTAESHDRIMIMEVMGRDSGYIALHGGLAGGAHVILLPEIAFDYNSICKKIFERQKHGKNFSLIVVSEGAYSKDAKVSYQSTADGREVLGGVGQKLAHRLFEMTKIETRVTVLGHLQRGGAPNAQDKILASRFAKHAVDLIHEGKSGRLVVINGRSIGDVAFADIEPSKRRMISLTDDILLAAEAQGICLGR